MTKPTHSKFRATDQCAATTARGRQCKRTVGTSDRYCSQHLRLKQRGGIAAVRTLGWAAKIGAILACPPLAILVGMNELANLVKWRRTAKGTWSDEDENKMLGMKLLAGNPVAATKLLDKMLNKSTLPESHRCFFSILSKNFARTFSLGQDVETMDDLRPTS